MQVKIYFSNGGEINNVSLNLSENLQYDSFIVLDLTEEKYNNLINNRYVDNTYSYYINIADENKLVAKHKYFYYFNDTGIMFEIGRDMLLKKSNKIYKSNVKIDCANFQYDAATETIIPMSQANKDLIAIDVAKELKQSLREKATTLATEIYTLTQIKDTVSQKFKNYLNNRLTKLEARLASVIDQITND